LPTSVDLYAALRYLGERDLLQVMCEGGATLHGALLDAGLYDEAALYLARADDPARARSEVGAVMERLIQSLAHGADAGTGDA